MSQIAFEKKHYKGQMDEWHMGVVKSNGVERNIQTRVGKKATPKIAVFTATKKGEFWGDVNFRRVRGVVEASVIFAPGDNMLSAKVQIEMNVLGLEPFCKEYSIRVAEMGAGSRARKYCVTALAQSVFDDLKSGLYKVLTEWQETNPVASEDEAEDVPEDLASIQF